MASTESTNTRARGESWQQPGAKWQQSTDQLQKSTSAMWRRSASALSESKDRCHQSTMETYHRSADSWSESKDRYRQNTLDMMSRSAESWTESKDRCRRSTLEMIHRSTTRLAQSAARMQQKQRQALLMSKNTETGESLEPTLYPQQSPTQLSMECDQPPPPRYYSSFEQSKQPETSQSPQETEQASQLHKAQETQQAQPSQPYPSPQTSESTTPSPIEVKEPTRPRAVSLLSGENSNKKLKPEDQARALVESMDEIVAQVVHAKHLQDSKSTEMGEIEYNWVNSTITNTEMSARSLARVIQTYRQDMAKNKGKISSSNRKSWKNKDFQLAVEKQTHLLSQQDQLEKVITHLQDHSSPSEASSSPVESPRTPDEPTIETIVELAESEPVLISELPANQRILELDATSVLVELPSEPVPKATPYIAELSEDAAIVRRPLASVPKIIVSGVSDSPAGTLESPKRTELSYEVHEINEMLKQTRTDTREQQSESLSKIVARMETSRAA